MSVKENLSRQITFDTKELVVCGLLLLAILGVFGRSIYFGFINYDDDMYVYENAHVFNGWTLDGVAKAFSEGYGNTWAPMMWLSLMTDSQFYGPIASGYHLTNILLHAAAAILLFVVIWRMTRDFWPSTFVAALFAIHPLRVESVVWVTERKDVLSGVFFALTLLTYLIYVRRPFSWWRYAAVLAAFTLGLMSKPVLVAMPFVLLALDYWPLNRLFESNVSPDCPRLFGFQNLSVPVRRALEKVPFLLLSGCVALATLAVQTTSAMAVEKMPLAWRIQHAIIAYVDYIGQILWPTNLALLYPRPLHLPILQVAACAAVLIVVSVATWMYRRRCPYLLVGWLWYLLMMLPAIGLVQFGAAGTADRFTYLPCIGLLLGLTWGAVDLWRRKAFVGQKFMAGVAVLLFAVSVAWTWHQTNFWTDANTIWERTIACTTNNFVAHNNLGLVLAERGNVNGAIENYNLALKINPKSECAYNNLGNALRVKGRPEDAAKQFLKAMELAPKYLPAYNNLGNTLAMQGKYDEAISYYKKALEIDPKYLGVYNNLATALMDSGRPDEAAVYFQKTLDLDPRNAMAHNGLGTILVQKNELQDAMKHFHMAVRYSPLNVSARNNLGSVLVRLGWLDEALLQYQAALKFDPSNISVRNNFAKILGIQGWLGGAAAQYKKVLKADPDNMEALRGLAWLRATCSKPAIRNGIEALTLAQKAEKLAGGKHPDVLDALAAAYAENGKFPEALATARNALALASEQKNKNLVKDLQNRISLYEAQKPFREELQQEQEEQ